MMGNRGGTNGNEFGGPMMSFGQPATYDYPGANGNQ